MTIRKKTGGFTNRPFPKGKKPKIPRPGGPRPCNRGPKFCGAKKKKKKKGPRPKKR